MAETERQKAERMLREELARIRQAEEPDAPTAPGIGLRVAFFAKSRALLRGLRWPKPARAFAGGLPSRPRPARWIEAAVRLPLERWRARKRESDRLAELQDKLAALRSERAADELLAAAAASPEGRRLRMPAAKPVTRGASPGYDLPNVSSGGLKLAAMKEAPARDWGPPPKVQFPRPEKKKDHRSDLIVAALGVVLGLTCALFPWYIFFNQEQFGVQAIAFGGRGDNAGRIVVDPKPGTDIAQVASQRMPKNLDLFSTGTVQAKPEKPEDAPGVDQQPFPAEADFRLVHVANGRAMIQDDAGLWIVQQGSSLPDSTRVKSIEKRNGHWVLVTSADRVIEISK